MIKFRFLQRHCNQHKKEQHNSDINHKLKVVDGDIVKSKAKNICEIEEKQENPVRDCHKKQKIRQRYKGMLFDDSFNHSVCIGGVEHV